MYSTLSKIQIVIVVAAFVACITTLSVMITFLIFPHYHQLRFMQIIFCLSFCNFMMGIVTLFGFPQTGTNLCYAQGILSNYFSISSWFWTTALSYVTYSVIVTGYMLSDRLLHGICWLVPLFLVLIPFVDASYGSVPDQWCLVVTHVNSSESSIPWSFAAYFGWLFLCCLLIVIWGVAARINASSKSAQLSVLVKRTYDKVYLYPIAMIVLWIVNFVGIDISDSKNDTLSACSMIFGVSYGTISSIIFFVKSHDARQKWLSTITPTLSHIGINLRPPAVQNTDEIDDSSLFQRPTTVGGINTATLPRVIHNPVSILNESFVGENGNEGQRNSDSFSYIFSGDLRETYAARRTTLASRSTVELISHSGSNPATQSDSKPSVNAPIKRITETTEECLDGVEQGLQASMGNQKMVFPAPLI